ncbi:16S rRNA (guanine(966)-N(2))-methyltransferase RsmD [Thalassotalea profundi]|uniref:Ribosomal RNA small subunit methyltransferase D n=1 Tax=Thalassotalea profundi TaxID=2036687 RepID=A0ABQ3IWK9_9GAMM|nr:16S rRNA (guanine(966)-N(2))-methyltransferase RsmD [Thalassotalea profundi]GHE95676.1 ribosomal RNA small subunit methyltransferase D [Thalassotalea profundi]
MHKAKKQQTKSSKNQTKIGAIRIISGKYRGRKLPVLMAEGLRPTTDRVKETLFNWLMPYINASNCLDCFAGAGSLGFEALSRGASNVTLIELDRSAAKQLNDNKKLLNAQNLNVINTNSLQYLAQPAPMNYDIVFIDPPFHQGLAEEACSLVNNGWLNKNALIYLEVESSGTALSLPENWDLLKEKIAGQVAYRLYQAT